MTSEELRSLIIAGLPCEQITVEGDGRYWSATVVSSAFEGKRPVARQQTVYAPLNSYIASGEVHAVTIRAMTKEEWRKASLFGA